jgi:hypothetical protein
MCELSGELIGSGDDFARTWTDRGRKPAEGTGARGSDDEQRDKCGEQISSVDTSGDMGDGYPGREGRTGLGEHNDPNDAGR